jgi:hypothetical protein
MEEVTIDTLKEMKQDYVDVFSSEKGKKVLEDLKRKCFFDKPTFSPDGMKMAFNEGKRAVVLHIMAMMTVNLDELAKFFKTKGGDNA